MNDLKKVEEKFHEYLKERLDEEQYDIDEIRISEELLERESAFHIPFGWVSYFLVIEDEKPVIYAKAISRMDLNDIIFIDENGYDEFDVWDGGHPEIREKYRMQSRHVKGFRDLQFIDNKEK